MKLIRTQGVVLRYVNRNEADRILTVLSPKLGKITVLARGCRKPKSKFLAFSQLFCYGDLILQPYREIFILNQAEVLNSHFDIRNDVIRLSYAVYMANLTEETATSGESNFPLFKLLLNGLAFISYADRDPGDLVLIYELKLLSLIGYRPSLESCIICGDDFSGRLQFNLENGGIACGKCSAAGYAGISVSSDTIKTMDTILNTDYKNSAVIPISPQVKEEMNRILPVYIEQKLQVLIKSRNFIASFFTPMS
jgi:DNA repair protein RecO (recombination protein O)